MLFGMETELAFGAWGRAGAPRVEAEPLLRELYDLAHRRLVSLRDESGPGLYLSNGARFYLDRGDHPEICTPECQSPADVVRWQLACERVLAELVAELEKRHPGLEAALFRCNVDYTNGESWGCHESYQHKTSHAELAPNLIPHLVTRIAYTGAGGFHNRTRRLEFLLSPRVPQLVQEVGGDTPERAIYNMRDEALSRGGYSRLHVICGESLCSELATYLKLGTTALVVRLVDAGVCRGRRLALRDALRAMRRIAADPTLRAKVELESGHHMSALEIQAEYLAMVEAQLGADFMPAWAPALCRRWRQVLARLAEGPEAVATSLDWGIKRALFEDRMARAGARRGTLQRRVGLGAELCEVDTRFGELSPRALFRALDEAGALEHRIEERGSVEEAMAEPPLGTRAELRGRAIRELHGERAHYRCRWDAIHNVSEGRSLDLSDPFATAVAWQERPRARGFSGNDADRLIGNGLERYNAQDTQRAALFFDQAWAVAERSDDAERAADARFWSATARHDAGHIDGAMRVLAPALAATSGLSPATRIRVATRQTLLELERPTSLAAIERALARERAEVQAAGDGTGFARTLLNQARVLAARGQSAEAADKAEEALVEAGRDPIAFSLGSYFRWLVTFLLRAGRYRRALVHLDAWRERVGRPVDTSYLGVSLAIADSQLALRLGRAHDALERAWAAVEHSRRYRRHRSRLAAGIAYLEAAAASRTFEACAPILDELHGWHDVEIGEMRYDLLRAEALVALAKGEGAREEADARLAAAREVAEGLDAVFGCGRCGGELEQRVGDLG